MPKGMSLFENVVGFKCFVYAQGYACDLFFMTQNRFPGLNLPTSQVWPVTIMYSLDKFWLMVSSWGSGILPDSRVTLMSKRDSDQLKLKRNIIRH